MWQKVLNVFFENFFEYYFLNIIMTYDFFNDLNITTKTILKYYHKEVFNIKVILMGGAMKQFTTKLLDHEIFSSMVPGQGNIF